jgi:hypothetical protein
MRGALQVSLTKTAVSMAAALVMAGGSATAGDKIQFSIPGSLALGQKPDPQSKDNDSQAPVKFDAGMQAPNMAEFNAPVTVVVIPADRNKRNGLHAWDSGMKPFNLEDQDSLLAPDAKPAPNGVLTNSYDAKSEWTPGSDLLRTDTHMESLSRSSTQSQSPSTQSGSSYWSGMNLLSGSGMEDSASRNTTRDEKTSETSDLSAWGKTFMSQKESYSERVEEYRSMYQPPALNVEGSDSLAKAVAPPSADVGSDAILDLSREDNSPRGRDGLPSAFDSYNSDGNSPVGASRYNAANSGIPVPSQAQTRPPVLNPFGGGSQPMAAQQPVFLAFPKKPGSLFQ